MSTAIVVADAGIDIMLPAYFAASDVKLKLFCNNYTPVRGMTAGSFTEAAGGGYAAITLTHGNWTEESNTPRDLIYAQQTFTFTGALTTNPTIYGYYITTSNDATVLWAQLLDSTFTPANNGDNLKITPKLQASTGTPA